MSAKLAKRCRFLDLRESLAVGAVDARIDGRNVEIFEAAVVFAAVVVDVITAVSVFDGNLAKFEVCLCPSSN